jgi:hypothetical protein
MNKLQLSKFKITLINQQIIEEPIENINNLYEIINIYGRGIIDKIYFYFYNYNNSIILKKINSCINDRFILEFEHNIDSNKLYMIESLNNILNNTNLSPFILPYSI